MHIQHGTQNWPTAIPLLPAGALVKSVNDFGRLKEAVEVWQAAGKPRSALVTCYRFHSLFLTVGDFESCRTQWRSQFAQFLTRSNLPFFEDGHINLVEDVNEYTATSTWTSPEETAKVLQSMRAAVAVWNDEIRGQRITTADGAVGTIPAGCKLVLCNGPVGNDIAREVLQLGVATDNPIGYHPYTRYANGQRFADDWHDDSGRWHFMEQAAGLRPEWVFTECGPYAGVNEGWRHPTVLDARADGLVEAMRAWARDVLSTPAYHEERLLGWTGAWFTVGGGGNWPWYELEADHLRRLASMFAEEWKPPAVGGPAAATPRVPEPAGPAPEPVGAPWWESWPEGLLNPTRRLGTPPVLIQMCRADGSAIEGLMRRNDMDVWERRGALLRVLDSPIDGELWWVRASDVQPE